MRSCGTCVLPWGGNVTTPLERGVATYGASHSLLAQFSQGFRTWARLVRARWGLVHVRELQTASLRDQIITCSQMY